MSGKVPIHEKPILTLEEACELSGAGLRALKGAIARGELAARNLEGPLGYRITARALLAWVDGGGPSEPPPPPPPPTTTMIAHQIVIPNMSIETVDALLASLHEGAEARIHDGRLEISHDGAPLVWFPLGLIAEADLAAAEEHCAAARGTSPA